MDCLVTLLIIVVIVVARYLYTKATAGNAAARQVQRRPQPEQFQASQDEVRKFLEQVSGLRAQQTEQGAQAAPEVDEDRVVTQLVALPSEEVQAPPSVPQAPPAEPAAPAPQAARKRPARAAAAGAAAVAARKAMPVAVKLAGSDLRKAVIWSEILGPPVCLRRGFGHRPHTMRR